MSYDNRSTIRRDLPITGRMMVEVDDRYIEYEYCK
jgi:hypothetical protein